MAWTGIALLTLGALLPVGRGVAGFAGDMQNSEAGTAARAATEDDPPPPLSFDDLPSPADLPADVLEPGDEIVVVLNSGRRLRGELVENESWSWVISIAGVRTSIRKEQVSQVRKIHPFEYYYAHLKSTIPPNDYGRRIDFAEWIYRQKRYDLAAEEVDLLLQANPNFEEARELLRRIDISREFAAKQQAAGGSGGTLTSPSKANNSAEMANERLAGTRLLDRDEINLLRVYEVDLADPPRMLVDRSSIDRLISEYGESDLIPDDPAERSALYQRDAVAILEIMFQLQARELYNTVRIIGEPETFRRFRNDVHRAWVIRGCAAAECHGGPDAGDLILHRDRANNERVAYTNFLILDRYRLSEDGRPLIDTDNPAASPLLQMGLPPHWSNKPHPPVRGWVPVFRSPDDPLFQASVAWIETLFAPRPTYPIEYTPPHVKTAGDDAGDGAESGGTGR